MALLCFLMYRQGIVAPVQAEVRVQGAGIGASGAASATSSAKPRRNLAKTVARYNAL